MAGNIFTLSTCALMDAIASLQEKHKVPTIFFYIENTQL
jgi:phage-related holin